MDSQAPQQLCSLDQAAQPWPCCKPGRYQDPAAQQAAGWLEPELICRVQEAELRAAAGKYSEQAFQALDYILDEASKLGVRLILTMVDNWSVADSKSQVSRPYLGVRTVYV